LLSLSPLSHHIAWVGVAQWLVAGCRFVCNDPPAGSTVLDWIIDSGATYVMGVPTHAMDVLAPQRARPLRPFGRVSVFYMAGAPIAPSLAAAFVAQGITPQNVYGMTENSSHQYTHPSDATPAIVSSCGRGGAAYQVRLFDPVDRERPVAAGEVGEIGGPRPAPIPGRFSHQGAPQGRFKAARGVPSRGLATLSAARQLDVAGAPQEPVYPVRP